jgi:hypothetical protein
MLPKELVRASDLVGCGDEDRKLIGIRAELPEEGNRFAVLLTFEASSEGRPADLDWLGELEEWEGDEQIIWDRCPRSIHFADGSRFVRKV